MYQPISNFEKRARAAALLCKVYAQNHTDSDHLSSEVVTYLNGITPLRSTDFSTSNDDMDFIFLDLWFRKQIKLLSQESICIKQRG